MEGSGSRSLCRSLVIRVSGMSGGDGDVWLLSVADPENFGGGMIKILSTKPQKFGCAVNRRKARNSQWSGCFRGLGAEPPVLQNFAFLQK